MSRQPPQTPPTGQWPMRNPPNSSPYTSTPVRQSPVNEHRPQMGPGPMYNGQQQHQSVPQYSYGGQQNGGPPGWVPSYVPEGPYQQNWYMPDQGPSSATNGFQPQQHQQPFQQGFPPGNPVFQPPMQGGPFPPTFTPPQSGNGNFDNSVAPPPGSAKADKMTVPKKKRKKTIVEPEAAGSVATSPPGDGDKEKRMKTGRACDACRTKKIRCDILPSDSPDVSEVQPICAHCKQYELECTFFLPITETRFKKRKDQSVEPVSQSANMISRGNTAAGSPGNGDSNGTRPHNGDTPSRMEGPTSLSFLLQTSIPAGASELYDLREHHKWDVSEDGDGLIRVRAPPSSTPAEDVDDPTRSHNRLNKPALSAQLITHLVNAYFDDLAPLLPLISRSEFAARVNPSPLLLYSICGLGATRRQFPREVFASVRGVINGLLRSNDILSDARFENVQALSVICMHNPRQQPPVLHWSGWEQRFEWFVRLQSKADPQAQDLGLHRESTQQPQTAQDLAYVEQRRRVWATCVILDRWYGAALGIPLLVDLLDCDVLLPAPYRIVRDTEPNIWPIDPSFMALSEHLKLSILVGRVLKTIYSPTGLKHTSDDQLESIRADMASWLENLPEELRFKGSHSSFSAGLLHMSHAALQFLFWRVFMRVTYTCPAHITFRLHIHHWTQMVDWSRESMEWLAGHDEALDTLFIYSYTATSCALIQYHTWARRRDQSALDTLRLIKEVALRWETAVQPDQMSIRRKTCETMTLLYEAALKTNPEHTEDRADRPLNINPTPGVSTRDPFGRAVFVKDEKRPNGGIWVAQTEEDREASGIPKDECFLACELPGGVAVSMPNVHDADEPHDQMGIEHPHQLPPQFEEIQKTPNLNPQMNFDGFLANGENANLEFMNPGNMGFTDTGFDGNILDGLPVNGFDFPSWELYFQAINQNLPQDQYTLGT